MADCWEQHQVGPRQCLNDDHDHDDYNDDDQDDQDDDDDDVDDDEVKKLALIFLKI